LIINLIAPLVYKMFLEQKLPPTVLANQWVQKAEKSNNSDAESNENLPLLNQQSKHLPVNTRDLLKATTEVESSCSFKDKYLHMTAQT